MAKTTRATQFLNKAGVTFTVQQYDYDPNAFKVGLQAAEAIGEPADRVLKTLMADVDGKPVCAVVPSNAEVSMKKLAAAFGGKHAHMLEAHDAERLSGYHVGGISPFGQRKRLPVVFEEKALSEPYIIMNGGQRGLQVKLAPADAVSALSAISTGVVA
ncbi:Cys-tRNA(Pro) deacylase [Martelella mediterranea]|uniref:Cys-tRNA(Pro)/Cys-tRNA(Cys) deacylase n=1 Tax=Martelella mediterranea TaxID=293089 RepID=A0A4R3NVA6_9HYPH|nr:Cys-tRNA(Pro) deacylase [Martelella mediterranea]TCT42066.1 Cys-tRNA(Pro)/Cys-tRNA(Cys) deacylase [Martelella mediterranea]